MIARDLFPALRRHALTGLALVALALSLGACGGDDPTSIEPVADVDGYLAALPSWEEFSPPLPNANVQIGDPVEETHTFEGTDYDCTVTEYDLTQNPREIVTYNPDSEILWLGALLQGKGYVDGIGSLQELPIRQRGPMKITIDLLTGDNTRTVNSPDAATVNSAIGELIQAASDAGHKAGSSIFYDEKQTYSLEQSALDLGFSARYMGSEVSGKLSFDQSFEENTLTAYFVQRMFTTSMILPQEPQEVFGPDFTEAQLQEQVDRGRIGEDNLPTFISSISWGRLMMLTMTSTYSVSDMKAALEASYESVTGDGGGGSVSGELLTILSNSEIQVVTVGGDDESALGLLKSGKLGDFFDTTASLTSARPISYTVRNLADNTIAKVSETTRYAIRECSAVAKDPTGAQFRIQYEGLMVTELGCDGFLAPTPEVYYSFYAGTTAGLGNPVASRSSSNTLDMEKNVFHDLNASARTISLYKDGRGLWRLYGNAYDYDGGSADELIGSWDHTYRYSNIPIGTNKYWTKSGAGCSIRLYISISKVKDLYD